MSLTLIVPKSFPPSGPLRIMIDVPSTLLTHFDSSLENLDMQQFMRRIDHHPVSLELARRAMTTCFGPSIPVPEIHESYTSNRTNNTWGLKIYFDYLVPEGEKNPPVVSFQASREADEDGNVEFNPIMPRTAMGRSKYNRIVTPELYEVMKSGGTDVKATVAET